VSEWKGVNLVCGQWFAGGGISYGERNRRAKIRALITEERRCIGLTRKEQSDDDD